MHHTCLCFMVLGRGLAERISEPLLFTLEHSFLTGPSGHKMYDLYKLQVVSSPSLDQQASYVRHCPR
jgi:hypothetical protein